MKRKLITFIAAALAGSLQAAIVLDVNFSHLTAGDTISDGSKIQDTSGNGYHGFWGDASGSYPIVTTPTGSGVDSTLSTRGHMFVRDGLTGIPDAWDGGTTTTTPYFTLESGSSYTFEALVNFQGNGNTLNGLMGQIGGNEFWMRENGGNLQYAFVSGASVTQFGSTISIAGVNDSNWHHIAVVLDRTENKIRSYLDYSLVYTDNNAGIASLGAMVNGTSDFRVGAYNTTDSNSFKGIQDHYRISNTALAPSEFIGAVVPEPGSALLLLTGSLLIGLLRRR